MKQIIFLTCFILVSCKAFSQANAINDSLINKICNALNLNRHLSDTLRLREVSLKYIFPAIMNLDSSKRRTAFMFIENRLQRNCKEFSLIVERLNPNKGDWIHEDKKPVGSLQKKACEDFIKIKRYSYMESNGDTVHLTIDNNLWEDHFSDGTYSKLKFHFIGDCEFEIEFIESNNETRKSFSHPGDKYKYQILSKEKGYYKLSVELAGANQFYTFKMYY